MSSRPSRPAAGRAARERLWPAGCLGAAIGVCVSLCGLLALLALLTGGKLPAASEPRAPEDIIITVQEAYLAQAVAQNMPALPSALTSAVELDLQPGNIIVFAGRLRSTLPGLALEGKVSGVIHLETRDGDLTIRFSDMKMLGFSLPAVGTNLANELMAGLNQTINQQIRDGLGQDARLISLTTDDRQLVLRGRWQP